MNALWTSKVLGQHGAVKSHEPGSLVKVSQQRGRVAVSAEDFGIGRNQIEVQMGKQVVGAISSTSTDDGLYLRGSEHAVQFLNSPRNAAREVQLAIQNPGLIYRIKAELSQVRQAALKFASIDWTRGRNNANCLSGLQSRGAHGGWGQGNHRIFHVN
jgi:hypothetical protein